MYVSLSPTFKLFAMRNINFLSFNGKLQLTCLVRCEADLPYLLHMSELCLYICGSNSDFFAH